jgi:hypothetical protein
VTWRSSRHLALAVSEQMGWRRQGTYLASRWVVGSVWEGARAVVVVVGRSAVATVPHLGVSSLSIPGHVTQFQKFLKVQIPHLCATQIYILCTPHKFPVP